MPAGMRLILSHHDYEGTPETETLQGVLARMLDAGADVPKIACVANDVADSARMLQLAASSACARPLTLKLGGGAMAEWSGFATCAFWPCEQHVQVSLLMFCVFHVAVSWHTSWQRLMRRLRAAWAAPMIALSMGERGLPCRLLAPKFGGVLTFGALSAGRESAPGQPTVAQLRRLYRLPHQRSSTQARMPQTCSAALQPPGRLRRAGPASPSHKTVLQQRATPRGVARAA